MMPAALLVLSTLACKPLVEVHFSQPPAPPAHQLSLTLRSEATLYLSQARTQGGLGGGVGVRDTLRGRWLLQADVSGLTGLGSVLAVRLSAGLQRQGVWAPAALVNLTGLFGERLDFFTPEHPLSVSGPAVGLGVTLAPIRFQWDRTQLSVLEVGVGLGTDRPGRGTLLGLTLLEVGRTF